MHLTRIPNARSLAVAIERQLEENQDFQSFKKWYAVLLVLQHPDNNCSDIARVLGLDSHTLARWVKRVTDAGVDDLQVDLLETRPRSGRPTRLTTDQLNIIYDAILKAEEPWTGKTLSQYILDRFHVAIQIRQCQKMLHKFRDAADEEKEV